MARTSVSLCHTKSSLPVPDGETRVTSRGSSRPAAQLTSEACEQRSEADACVCYVKSRTSRLIVTTYPFDGPLKEGTDSDRALVTRRVTRL